MPQEKKYFKLKLLLAFTPLLFALVIVAFIYNRAESLKNAAATPLNPEEFLDFQSELNALYSERTLDFYESPFRIDISSNPNFDTNAEAAILINAKTGEILYEKNADQEIPPASMIKLFLVYGALQKVAQGKIALDDVIPIDKRALAANMPPNSSLMFLGLGQIVTLRELLQGLSVASGNDAAYQIAYSLYGSMENFIEETNTVIKSLGLKKTKIVESSGYSEKNITTPREMAAFCKFYLNEFPDTLQEFHAVKKIVYPQKRNLLKSDWEREAQHFAVAIPEKIWTPIEQENTNKLLGVLEGCDGIKTGHIDESGYNLALTTKRGETRYISVTMLGPGKGTVQGDKFRCADGTLLHETAYSSFEEFKLPPQIEVCLPLYGSKEKAVLLCPAYEKTFTIPKKPVQTPDGIKAVLNPAMQGMAISDVECAIEKPEFLFGKIQRGAAYAKIIVSREGITLAEIPLVAEKDCEEASEFIKRCDVLILKMRY